jgi:hypothetical protein
MELEQNQPVVNPGMEPGTFTPSSEAPPLEPLTPQPDYRRRRLLLGLLLLVIFAASAVAAYAYSTSPARVMAKAEKKFIEAKTLEYEAEAEFRSEDTAAMFGSFTVNLSGIADLNKENARNSTSVRLTMDGGDDEGTISVNADVRSVDKTMYFKIGKVPMLEMFLGDVAGKWYKFDLKELSDALGSDELKELTENEEEYNEKMREVQKAYEKYEILKIKKKLASEVIESEGTYHYEWYLDKAELEKFLDEAYKIMGEEQPEDILAEFKDEIKGELWIGKKTYYLRKVTVVLPNGSMRMSFKNYDKTAAVEIPENAESIESLLGGALGEAREQSRDAKRIADVRQLATALELYYNDTGGYPANLKELTPAYIGAVPEAPERDGACTDAQNAYAYRMKGAGYPGTNQKTVYGDYELGFCLGAEAGGYAAGPRLVDPSGIK